VEEKFLPSERLATAEDQESGLKRVKEGNLLHARGGAGSIDSMKRLLKGS